MFVCVSHSVCVRVSHSVCVSVSHSICVCMSLTVFVPPLPASEFQLDKLATAALVLGFVCVWTRAASAQVTLFLKNQLYSHFT